MALSYNQATPGRRLERIAALSDGVFAIAMTLIVLEIHVPDAGPIHSERDLWDALLGLGPRLLTYFLSFLTLGIFWNGQQTQLNLFSTADRDLTWLQLASSRPWRSCPSRRPCSRNSSPFGSRWSSTG